MTPEELLRQRFKVIADYPGNLSYDLGDILTLGSDGYFRNLKKQTVFPVNFTKYPHLFKFLEWWEERAEGDLPMFLKSKFTNFPHKVADWQECNSNGIRLYYVKSKSGLYMPYDCKPMLPISETEYKKLIKTTHP